jgi:DNA-binding HxlR family transcriptional regulator
VGERWTLLVVRELLTGPKRFKDLAGNLPGIGTGLLAARLKHLADAGIIERATLPPPAGTAAYRLTEAGRDLEPAIMALARWGLRWALGQRAADDTFRPGWAALGLQASFQPAAAQGLDAVYELRVGEETFGFRVVDDGIETRYGPADRPDVVIEMTADDFLELASGRRTLDDAVRTGQARVAGDRRLLEKLPTLFSRPGPA